ncbi:glucose-1-phosphate thymidylyltransferase [Halobacteriales archaeon SW_7_65_23]|nr:MAG: glucose-1-phosphate thymidylyltransferase [Halobacteriales archaeon SW_7_65_23]
MKAVILAAGEGRRLQPLTNRRPKPMLPVLNKPVLEYVVEAVADAGIDGVVLVVGYQRERIQTYFGDGDQWDIDIEYAVQEDQLGTGHAVQQVRSLVDEEFLVLNGDRIIEPSLVEDVRATAGSGTNATLSVTRVESPGQYGIVVTENDDLVRVEEKPVGDPSSNVINAGVYRFTDAIFPAIDHSERSPDGEVRLPSAITHLAAEASVDVVRYRGQWLDVTYPWDLLSVNDRIVTEQDGAHNRQIDDTAAVTDGVTIGRGATIGPNATVKRGTSLGANVSVGANVVVSNAVVMQDVTVADGAVIRDCIIDENATVGPNATVSGGTATLTVEDTVHRDVSLGAVVGANTELGGEVVLRPGTVVGDDVTAEGGTVLSGDIDANATVHGG